MGFAFGIAAEKGKKAVPKQEGTVSAAKITKRKNMGSLAHGRRPWRHEMGFPGMGRYLQA
jgi:hypothetical protein